MVLGHLHLDGGTTANRTIREFEAERDRVTKTLLANPSALTRARSAGCKAVDFLANDYWKPAWRD